MMLGACPFAVLFFRRVVWGSPAWLGKNVYRAPLGLVAVVGQKIVFQSGERSPKPSPMEATPMPFAPTDFFAIFARFTKKPI
jgi:hypothetical protein